MEDARHGVGVAALRARERPGVATRFAALRVAALARAREAEAWRRTITSPKHVRCAIYTRVSDDQGLEQDFNSLDAPIRCAIHIPWSKTSPTRHREFFCRLTHRSSTGVPFALRRKRR